MLVLTRKKEETIRIGENIIVKVVRIRGNTVRIGIEAPTSLSVRRGELPPKEMVVAPLGNTSAAEIELASAAS